MDICAVVLAAGLGTRMRSSLPKVLHRVLEQTLLSHVLDNLQDAGIVHVAVVTGHGASLVEKEAAAVLEDVKIYRQTEMLGTGDALKCASDFFSKRDGYVLVVCGDAPLIDGEVLKQFIDDATQKNLSLSVLSAEVDEPAKYGRIIRRDGHLTAIREALDCTAEELGIREVNSGAYLFDAQKIASVLPSIANDNGKGEYYLTDAVQIFLEKNWTASAFTSPDPSIIEAVNNLTELAAVQSLMQAKINRRHMEAGVAIPDPKAVYIGRHVTVDADTSLHPGCELFGKTSIGKNNIIRDSRILDSEIGEDNEIISSAIEESVIENECAIGPFSHLRPGCHIESTCRIGNYTEVKNARIGAGTKAAHLTYIGDAIVGERVNFGCGSITVNYDGKKKHVTIIGSDAFIGSNVNLIAPITIGASAFIGAGTTVSKDVPENALAVGRADLRIIPNYGGRKSQRE